MATATPFGAGVRRFHVRRQKAPPLIDWVLLAAPAGLAVASVLTLGTSAPGLVPRQIIYAAVGFALMLAISRFDYSRLRELKLGIYLAMIAMFMAVFVVGAAAKGSTRWVELPFFRFQPSELGKLMLILALSAVLVDRYRSIGSWKTTALVLALGLFPAGLVLVQPDLGTSLVYVSITTGLLIVAGTRWTQLVTVGALAVVAAATVLIVLPSMNVPVLKPYQQARLTVFLNPDGESQKWGYQQEQALVAVGSGGRTGRGSEGATQTQLEFLPEDHTDFIFAAIGERFGFLGAAVVLGLYALLVWRGLRIVTISKNMYGVLVAGGIVAMFMFQIFVPVGMALGIAPITGVPLPIVSFGGSSMITALIACGILQSIYVQGMKASRSKKRAAVPA